MNESIKFKTISGNYQYRKRRKFITFEECLKSALKFKYRQEWAKNESRYYKSAKYHGWFDKCVKHMYSPHIEYNKKWTLDTILIEIKKYKTREEWHKNSNGSYFAAKRDGHFELCIQKMKEWNGKKYDKNFLLNDAKNYNRRIDWFRNSTAAYKQAKRYGCFKECVQHMGKPHNKGNEK